MDLSSPIFRETAVKHCLREDALTADFRVLSMSSWVYLGLLLVGLLSFVVCSVSSAIPLTSHASGMIIHQQGKMLPIVNTEAGRITKIFVTVGDVVHEGDILATMSIPNAEETLSYLSALKHAADEALADFLRYESSMSSQLTLAKNTSTDFLTKDVDTYKRTLTMMMQLRDKKEKLYHDHNLSFGEWHAAESDYAAKKEELHHLLLQSMESPSHYAQAQEELDRRRQALSREAIEAAHALQRQQLQYQQGGVIRSPADGTIIAINAALGEALSAERTLATLSVHPNNDALSAALLIPQAQGQQVKPGMPVYALPAGAQITQQPYLRGHIVTVSSYPMSKRMAFTYIGNTSLVNDVFSQGAPLLLTVAFPEDKSTEKSLYGASMRAGMWITADIVTARCSPLRLLWGCSVGMGV
jgi:multidrug resistance efflux pump